MNTLLHVPRGTPGEKDMALDMSLLKDAERRLAEVRLVSPATCSELGAFFNEACALATKYMAWIEYEVLKAEKQVELAKATVILDKAPEEFKKMKDTGIKYNEDFRNALIARDEECQKSLDILNSLKAVKALVSSHADTFKRAHYSCKEIAQARGYTAATPNLAGSTAVGSTYETDQNNFMGQRRS